MIASRRYREPAVQTIYQIIASDVLSGQVGPVNTPHRDRSSDAEMQRTCSSLNDHSQYCEMKEARVHACRIEPHKGCEKTV
jgi:hypothetical protein